MKPTDYGKWTYTFDWSSTIWTWIKGWVDSHPASHRKFYLHGVEVRKDSEEGRAIERHFIYEKVLKHQGKS